MVMKVGDSVKFSTVRETAENVFALFIFSHTVLLIGKTSIQAYCGGYWDLCMKR